MRFTPRSEAELEVANLIPEGQYPFQVQAAEDTTSKNGNDMIKLKLKVYDQANRERVVFDYLLGAMEHKLRHFAEQTGLIEKYNQGAFGATDCLDKTGYLHIVVDPPKNGYPAKNSVKDYCKKVEGQLKPPVQQSLGADFDQDIPF